MTRPPLVATRGIPPPITPALPETECYISVVPAGLAPKRRAKRTDPKVSQWWYCCVAEQRASYLFWNRNTLTFNLYVIAKSRRLISNPVRGAGQSHVTRWRVVSSRALDPSRQCTGRACENELLIHHLSWGGGKKKKSVSDLHPEGCWFDYGRYAERIPMIPLVRKFLRAEFKIATPRVKEHGVKGEKARILNDIDQLKVTAEQTRNASRCQYMSDVVAADCGSPRRAGATFLNTKSSRRIGTLVIAATWLKRVAKERKLQFKMRRLIVSLTRKGKSYSEIGNIAERSRSAVQSVTQRFKETKLLINIEKVGRPHCLHVERQLLFFLENRYRARVPRKKPYISKENRKSRLEFANTYVGKDLGLWNSVVFSDESKFNHFHYDSRVLVWNRPNSALDIQNLQATMKHGGGDVMVWECMAASGKFYERECGGTGFGKRLLYFQYDNDPKHTAEIVRLWVLYTLHTLKTLEKSPDLNRIKHLWSELERRVRELHICSKSQLKELLLKEWHIGAETTGNLVYSMSKRLREVMHDEIGTPSTEGLKSLLFFIREDYCCVISYSMLLTPSQWRTPNVYKESKSCKETCIVAERDWAAMVGDWGHGYLPKVLSPSPRLLTSGSAPELSLEPACNGFKGHKGRVATQQYNEIPYSLVPKAEEYTTSIQVDLKQGFQKCSYYREQPMTTNVHSMLADKALDVGPATDVPVGMPTGVCNIFVTVNEVNMEWRRNWGGGRGKRKIPERTRRPTASFGMISICESSVARPGIEPAVRRSGKLSYSASIFSVRTIGPLNTGDSVAPLRHATLSRIYAAEDAIINMDFDQDNLVLVLLLRRRHRRRHKQQKSLHKRWTHQSAETHFGFLPLMVQGIDSGTVVNYPQMMSTQMDTGCCTDVFEERRMGEIRRTRLQESLMKSAVDTSVSTVEPLGLRLTWRKVMYVGNPGGSGEDGYVRLLGAAQRSKRGPTGGNPEVLKHANLANPLTAGFCGLSTVEANGMEWNSIGTWKQWRQPSLVGQRIRLHNWGWLPDPLLPTFTCDVEILMVAQKSEDGVDAMTELPGFLPPSAGSLRTLSEVTAVDISVRAVRRPAVEYGRQYYLKGACASNMLAHKSSGRHRLTAVVAITRHQKWLVCKIPRDSVVATGGGDTPPRATVAHVQAFSPLQCLLRGYYHPATESPT
ncbi:hypothetical protein PR048_005656 [Dryococelus australis]|uniref:Uncharacterized protein n=1 Tax=Dryococelus australis TaxID=614101 RepID=A0ABQ9I8U5_9NEOP|nr:hypothetical protein PR048_005656 [Dryococelus australis]